MKAWHHTTHLKDRLRTWGASIIGFAYLEGIASYPFKHLPRGIIIGVRLSDAIVDELITGPTKAYAYHYHTMNRFLDSLAIRTVNILQKWGYKAFPIPTSQTVNWKTHEGHLSHKMVATQAGLGWIGKNALLITPKFGPRVRLTTVITNAPFRTGTPLVESQCLDCQECVKACPVEAIRGVNWSISSQRADLLDVDQCAKKIEQGKAELGAPVCGVCIQACPKGKNDF